jgi:DNA polymerase IV (DinB-like DNA polymerase)
MEQSVRTIFHIDMDSFYASVEAREHPEHKGKPIIVGADPKGGSGRGVVAACSYEARKFGVHSAMPISTAYRLVPHAVYLRGNYHLYEEISEQIMELLRSYTKVVEPMSIDEAFMDVTEKVKEGANPVELAEEIQKRILTDVELTCSIGIAHNKSIAKIASDYRKPAGITHVHYETFQEFLDPLPVGSISGVGPKTRDILNSIGITSIRDLRDARKHVVIEAMGNYGLALMNIASGKDNRGVVQSWGPSSSTSHESTFPKDTMDYNLIEEKIENMAKRLCEELEEKNKFYRTVTLKIRFEDFSTFTRAKSLANLSQSHRKALKIANELLKEFRTSHQKIRLVGLKLSGLRKLDMGQETLGRWL